MDFRNIGFILIICMLCLAVVYHFWQWYIILPYKNTGDTANPMLCTLATDFEVGKLSYLTSFGV